MKTKIINNEELAEFKPVKIELEIETKEEAFELYHRLSLATGNVREVLNKNVYKLYGRQIRYFGIYLHELFDVIKDVLTKQGFIK